MRVSGEDKVQLERTVSIAASICASQKGWGRPVYLNSGNSGSVFRLDHPTYGLVALKVYDPAFFEGDNALIEAKRVKLQEKLRSHGNPYLIEVLEASKWPADHTWYILMELCDWETLDARLAAIRDENVEPLLSQLVNAVMFLQSRSMVHRDIKPSNIAISPDLSRLKLLDLGVLRQISPEEGNGTDVDQKRRFVATAQYSPPEYLTREELLGETGFNALNVYQVGAVAHDLITKRPIFGEEAATQNRYILYKAVTSNRPHVSNPNLPPRLMSLCTAALEKNPMTRVAGVNLLDFLKPMDTASTLRRRLAAQFSATQPTRCPSILAWSQTVCNWVRDAAVRERSTLGPVRLRREQDHPGGAAWLLAITSLAREIRVELVL